MPKLYHFPLCPFSRRIRLAMGEHGVDCELVAEKPRAPSDALRALNPAGGLPVLVSDEGPALCGADAIANFLDETLGAPNARSLFGTDPFARAEVRRLVSWFDEGFNRDVTDPVVGEKVLTRHGGTAGGRRSPDMNRVRAGLKNVRAHLDYIGHLIDQRSWLAGDVLSHADLAAGAHISCLDYLGDVPWSANASARTWYARIKSRPSFRPLLGDHISGITPPRSYADLDF